MIGVLLLERIPDMEGNCKISMGNILSRWEITDDDLRRENAVTVLGGKSVHNAQFAVLVHESNTIAKLPVFYISLMNGCVC